MNTCVTVAGDGQCGVGTEGMATDADAVRANTGPGVLAGSMPSADFADDEADIFSAADRLQGVHGLLQPFAQRCRVAARMLHMQAYQAGARPRLAPRCTALTRAAQAVREQHDRPGAGCRRPAQANVQCSLAGGVGPELVHDG